MSQPPSRSNRRRSASAPGRTSRSLTRTARDELTPRPASTGHSRERQSTQQWLSNSRSIQQQPRLMLPQLAVVQGAGLTAPRTARLPIEVSPRPAPRPAPRHRASDRESQAGPGSVGRIATPTRLREADPSLPPPYEASVPVERDVLGRIGFRYIRSKYRNFEVEL